MPEMLSELVLGDVTLFPVLPRIEADQTKVQSLLLYDYHIFAGHKEQTSTGHKKPLLSAFGFTFFLFLIGKSK